MQKRSKKEQIADLLRSESLTDEQIALQVGTKASYVTKTKSILRKEGRLIKLPHTAQAMEPRSISPSVDYFTEQMQAIILKKTLKTGSNYPDSLTEKQVELLYTMLNGNTDPVAIIGTTGFSPAQVEIEFERFQRLKGRNMGEFQRQLLPFMESKGFRDPRLTKMKLGELSADELLNVINKFSLFQLKFGTNFAVDNPYYPLPEGWKRILCKKCGGPVAGVLIDSRSDFGKSIEGLLTASPTHSRHCMCDDQYPQFLRNAHLEDLKQVRLSAENIQYAIESSDNSEAFDRS